MTLPSLLAPPRRAELRRLLATRLAAIAGDAAAHVALSVTIDLGDGTHCDWLDLEFADTHSFWWARPEADEWRLAIGQALIVASAGPNRFPALHAAFAGLAGEWWHSDVDGAGRNAGRIPAAHLGFAFDEEEQEELPNARLVVPSLLLVSKGGRHSATFTCSGSAIADAVDGWIGELSLLTRQRPRAHGERDRPQRLPTPLADRAFIARVRAALAGIATGSLQKLVVSRSVRLQGERPIAVAPVLASLARRYPACTIYAVGRPGFAFVGATPERLVELAAGTARADALAGTAWAADGGEHAASSAPASLRLEDDKNSREQAHVVHAVRAALAPLCRSLTQSQAPEVLRLRHLQHLRTVFSGRVVDGVGLFDLIAALHPTPAVGGTPAAAARAWLRTRGERRAAWYSGGVGWIDAAGDGEVVVALRCARIAGNRADCHAGAGIVAGSDPEQEFAETEAKLGAVIDALCLPEAQASSMADAGQAQRRGHGRTGTR